MKKVSAFVLILLLCFVWVAFLRIEVVKAEPKTIVVPEEYSGIQDAIDHANAGDTVVVKPGNYSLPNVLYGIEIIKSISLIGDNKQNTIITQNPYRYNEAAIRISSNNVTVSGFTIESGGRACIEVDGSDCKIMDNIMIVNYSAGVFSKGGINNIISGNNIIGNNTGYSKGISLTSSGKESSNWFISNNTIASFGIGLEIDLAQKVNITRNNITRNGAGGISLSTYGQFYVYENNITDNTGFGIQLSSNCNQTTIFYNNIFQNEIGVRLDNVGVGNEVYCNNLVDNDRNVVVVQTGYLDIVALDNGSKGNYWSDYNGVDSDDDGIGDTPYIIDENNQDNNPLMEPIIISELPSWTSLMIVLVVVVAVLAVYRRRLSKSRGEAFK